jgi:hypothetical protein
MIEPLFVDCKLIERFRAGSAYFIDEISLNLPWQLWTEEVRQQILSMILY